MDVEFIALGSMGTGMSGNILGAGLAIKGIDVDDGPRPAFAEADGAWASRATDATAGGDTLILMAVNAEQAEEALFGDMGAATAMKPGTIVMWNSVAAMHRPAGPQDSALGLLQFHRPSRRLGAGTSNSLPRLGLGGTSGRIQQCATKHFFGFERTLKWLAEGTLKPDGMATPIAPEDPVGPNADIRGRRIEAPLVVLDWDCGAST